MPGEQREQNERQVMKEFFAFVRKEFLHIFRDRRTLLVLIGLPTMLIVLFGFAISTEIRNVNIGLYSQDDDIAVARLMEKIDQSEYFTYIGEYGSEEDVDMAMRRGEIDAALMFGPNFAASLYSDAGADISVVADATNPNNASMEVMYLTGIVADYFRDDVEEAVAVRMLASMSGDESGESVPTAMPGTVGPQLRMLYNPQLKSSYNFVPGIMGLILLLICALMTSVSIVREKETGSMEVLLVSPIKPINIVLAKMIPYFVISCAVLVNILLLTIFVLKVPVAGSFFWMILVSVIYIILSLGIGMLVSSLVKTQIIATLICGMIFLVPVMMFSGMLYPIESMPVALQWFAQTIPAKWFIEAIRKIMIEGVPVRYVTKEILIMTGMAVVIFAAAVIKFKDRLD